VRVKNLLKLSIYKQISIIITLYLLSGTHIAIAKELNAGFVLNQMSTDQRTGYLFGVVEGLAYARFLRDKPDQTGMNCIYDWYHGAGSDVRRAKVRKLMKKHHDRPVGPLLFVLLKKECGV
jgi:hypothetical protein